MCFNGFRGGESRPRPKGHEMRNASTNDRYELADLVEEWIQGGVSQRKYSRIIQLAKRLFGRTWSTELDEFIENTRDDLELKGPRS